MISTVIRNYAFDAWFGRCMVRGNRASGATMARQSPKSDLSRKTQFGLNKSGASL